MSVAVVDIGTISTRLCIASTGGPALRDARITHTGEGLRANKRVSADALGRLRSCLENYWLAIDASDVTQIRVVATAVGRDAANRQALAEAVHSALGVDVEILTGEDEARLSFDGAVQGLEAGQFDDRGMILVIDVGGGSTEFSLGSVSGGYERGFSADVGASKLTEAYLLSDPPQADELSAALSIVELHVDDVRREVPGLADALSSSGLVIGVGGTMSTMASIEIGLAAYDRVALHGFVLTRPAVEDVFRTLATETAEDRAFNPGLEADRVGLIVGGSCVVVETMRQLDIGQLVVSQSDLIDGIVSQMLEAA
jgi:exopolyphosphatase/guanosine-5'-triphosphate,3'-diphosphate pyrophosphatase